MSGGFGEPRSAENSTVTVGTTPVELFKAVPNRNYFYVYNGTAAKVLTVFLGEGTVTANNGVVLQTGESYTQSDSEGFRAWRGKVMAVCDAAGCTVSRQATEF